MNTPSSAYSGMTASVLDAFSASLYFASRAVMPSPRSFVHPRFRKDHYRSNERLRLAAQSGKGFSDFRDNPAPSPLGALLQIWNSHSPFSRLVGCALLEYSKGVWRGRVLGDGSGV
jgi:hypothetical protein